MPIGSGSSLKPARPPDMHITKKTEITIALAREINVLSDDDKKVVVDRLTIRQTEDLFSILLHYTI